MEGIETDRIFFTISEVYSFNRLADSLIGMTHINDHYMRPAFVVRSDHVISEKGFTTPRWADNDLVTVGNHTTLHQFIRQVHMQRPSGQSIPQTQAYRA